MWDRTGSSNPNWKGGVKRECLNCHQEFEAKHYDGQKFCSKKCYGQHRHQQNIHLVNCQTCGKEFQFRSHGKKGEKRFCSTACSARDPEIIEKIQSQRRGKVKLSAEARDKISQANVCRNAATSYTSGKNGFYESRKAGRVFYRSTYELKAFQLLDDCEKVVQFSVEPFVIKYQDRLGQTRRYRPDILVEWDNQTKTLIEVKPAWQYDRVEFLEKAMAGMKHSRQNDWEYRVWNENTLGIKFGTPCILNSYYYHYKFQ
jgi:endogenous inhibitor of DNA gyrase (YacG/DUF329 family)